MFGSFIVCVGAVELAAVGVSIAIFNQASKITIYPLVSITTSFVAEEETVSKMNAEVKDAENQHQQESAETGNSKEMMSQDDVLGKLEEGSITNIKKDDSLLREGPCYIRYLTFYLLQTFFNIIFP